MKQNNLSNPLVSVIIPTYNRAVLLQRAVHSVLQQSYSNFVLIIVDDASTDNTKEVIKTIADSRVILYQHKINQGQNASLNTGLSYSTGEYITFLDSDDEWLPTMLEKQVDSLLNDESLGVSYTWAGSTSVDGTLKVSNKFNIEGYIYKEALSQGYVSHMITIMVKKVCFDKIGLFDINFTNCQDDDICLRLAKNYKFKLIPEILAIIHSDGDNQITDNSKEYAQGWWKLFNKYEKDIVKYCGNKTMSKHFEKCFYLFIISNQYHLSFQALRKIMLYRESSKLITFIYLVKLFINIILNKLFKWFKNIFKFFLNFLKPRQD